MEFFSFTNEINKFINIVNNFEYIFKNFNVKNLGIKTLNDLKLNINGNYVSIEKFCNIKNINEKNFYIQFNDNNIYKKIIKINFFENYGFQIMKKKNSLELKIPNLSLEFRKNIIKIVKNEFLNHKEIIENHRKKILFNIKKNIKSIEEVKIMEKKLNNKLIIIKNNLKEIFEKINTKILNE